LNLKKKIAAKRTEQVERRQCSAFQAAFSVLQPLNIRCPVLALN
jgi:hypothetical protein